MPDIDYMVISHDHWDHLDYRTVKSLKDRVGKVICGLGVGEHFEYWGYDKDRLVELDWYEDAVLEMVCCPLSSDTPFLRSWFKGQSDIVGILSDRNSITENIYGR